MPPKRLKTSGGTGSKEGKKEKTFVQKAKQKAVATWEKYRGHRDEEKATEPKKGAQSSSMSTKGQGKLPEASNVEEARLASMKPMIVEAFADIANDYTEQDVFDSLNSTRMYAVFPHLFEGDEKAKAAPLSDAEVHSLIDYAELGDSSSEREGSARSIRASAIAGPSNHGARYSAMNRSTSTMESILDGPSARGSWPARAGGSNLSVNYIYDVELDNVSMKSTRPVDSSPTTGEESPVIPRPKSFYAQNNLSFKKKKEEEDTSWDTYST